MTKKQVLFSLRQRFEHARDRSEFDRSKVQQFSSIYEYYSGCIDSYDYVLSILCDYD